MSKSIKYQWLLFFFILISTSTTNATGILRRDKADGGHEGCCNKVLPFAGLSVDIILTIRGDVDPALGGFPWKIKAVNKFPTISTLPLGESPELNLSDFGPIDEHGLISTVITITLYEGLESPEIGICEPSRCGEESVSKQELVYKIFSGNEQVNIDNPRFDHPDLVPESLELDHLLYICNCLDVSSLGKLPPQDRGDRDENLATKTSSNVKGENSEQKLTYFEREKKDYIYPYPSLQNLKIYPNPANQQINVQFHTNARESILIEIFSLQGKRIARKSAVPIGKILTITTADLPNGIYILKIIGLNNRKEIIKKITIIH